MPNLILHLDTYADGPTEPVVRELRFEPTVDDVSEALSKGLYVAVGTFEGDDPETAWRNTQNGVATPSWSRMPPEGIVALGTGTIRKSDHDHGYRTSDLGDLFVVNGDVMMVRPSGFGGVPVELPSEIRCIDGSMIPTDRARMP